MRYWAFVLYSIGVPTFVRFDVTGLTHGFGLFNPWSIATIVLTLTAAFTFLFLTLLSRSPVIARRVEFGAWLWLSLLGILTLATLLEPNFPIGPKPATDVYLGLYRLGEWVLAFALFLSLYSREPYATSAKLVTGLIAKICWAWLFIVWTVLAFAPSFAYCANCGGEPVNGMHARLGGALLPPAGLALFAGVACFHALTCLKGARRVFAFTFGAVSLVLTYVRGEEIAFLLAIAVYAVFFARPLPRLIGTLGCGLGIILAVVSWSSITNYVERGLGASNVITLSERTEVWNASLKAFWQRPYIGYGFIAGVKGALRSHWKSAHWLPPHSHNDWIQATLSGGIVAGALLLVIYLKVLWSAVRSANDGACSILFLFTLLQLTMSAILGPLLSNQFAGVGSIYMLAFIAVVDHHSRKKRGRHGDILVLSHSPPVVTGPHERK